MIGCSRKKRFERMRSTRSTKPWKGLFRRAILRRIKRTRGHPRFGLESEGMKCFVIKVPGLNADILEIGQDCASLGQPNYIVEKIGEPFIDDKGWKMAEETLVGRA